MLEARESRRGGDPGAKREVVGGGEGGGCEGGGDKTGTRYHGDQIYKRNKRVGKKTGEDEEARGSEPHSSNGTREVITGVASSSPLLWACPSSPRPSSSPV